MGKTGSMKTTAYTIPNILNSIKLEESIIVTDLHGEILSKTKDKLNESGYKIKKIEMKYKTISNTVKLEEELVNYEITSKFAEEIMDVFGRTNDSYFITEGKLLLTALILYINTNESEKDRTILKVYESLTNIDELKEQFKNIEKTHIAKKAAKYFLNTCPSDITLISVISNVIYALKKYELYSLNNINFKELREEKCAHFIDCNKLNECEYEDISAIYLKKAFREINKCSNLKNKDSKKIKIFLENFNNIGLISNLSERVESLNDNNVSVNIILNSMQNLFYKYGRSETLQILKIYKVKLIFSDLQNFLDKEFQNKVFNKNTSIIFIDREEYIIANKIKNTEFDKKGF